MSVPRGRIALYVQQSSMESNIPVTVMGPVFGIRENDGLLYCTVDYSISPIMPHIT